MELEVKHEQGFQSDIKAPATASRRLRSNQTKGQSKHQLAVITAMRLRLGQEVFSAYMQYYVTYNF